MVETFSAPGFISAKSTFGSDISYIFAVAFTSMFLGAGLMAKRGNGRAHHWMILVSILTMTAYFIFYYKVRRLGLESLSDQISFHGPDWVFHKMFRPALYIHFLAVTLSFFSAFYMVANGFRTAESENGKMRLINKTVTRSKILWAAGLIWLAFLSWWVFSNDRFDFLHKGIFLGFGYFIPAIFAFAIGALLPESEKRHRAMGKLCLFLFALLLVTSTFVYFLLYVVY